MVLPGLAFLGAKEGDAREHLWVVITQPDPTTNKVLVVNVTTKRSHSDTTTILQPGEHPFVRDVSVVYYADATLVEANKIEKMLSNRSIHQQPSMPDAVLKRIQGGVKTSKFIPGFCQSFYSRAAKAGLT